MTTPWQPSAVLQLIRDALEHLRMAGACLRAGQGEQARLSLERAEAALVAAALLL